MTIFCCISTTTFGCTSTTYNFVNVTAAVLALELLEAELLALELVLLLELADIELLEAELAELELDIDEELEVLLELLLLLIELDEE